MSQPLEAMQKRLLGHFEDALARAAATWADEPATSWPASSWSASSWPSALVAPTRHALFGGGKRVRPMLALMAAEAVGGKAEAAIPWAMAVEMIHTYSLVHDDLPAMDDDDERRGRPTCHVAFGEAHAILAGDALLTEAFAVLAAADWPAERTVRLVALLAAAAGGAGMVGGQVLDIGGGLDTLAALEAMQRLKTGALICAAAEGGAIAAGGDAAQIDAIRAGGARLGLLFQLTDDLIDRQQDPGDAGKNVLDLLDLDAARRRCEAVAAEAIAAFAPLGETGAALVALVDAVARRTH